MKKLLILAPLILAGCGENNDHATKHDLSVTAQVLMAQNTNLWSQLRIINQNQIEIYRVLTNHIAVTNPYGPLISTNEVPRK